MKSGIAKEKLFPRTKKDPKQLKKSLEKGYKELSRINLNLAEDGVKSDNDALILCEENLRSVKNGDS